MKYDYNHNGNETSSGDGSLCMRRDVAATSFEMSYNEAQGPFYY